MPSQSNPADLISMGIEPTTLSTSTLWWKGPQWLSQEQSSWPTTETNSPTCNFEIRNVHIACLQPQEDHPEILQVKQTHQNHCLLQKIHTPLQTIQGQQASNHPIHTRSGPGSDLLCEDGTADFLCTRNQGLKRKTRSCFQQFSQDTAPIHR